MLLKQKIYISILLIFYFSSAAVSPTTAQERNLIKYTVENGLSLSQISGIDQSKDGFLVVGTYGGGISLFDGNNFENYNSTNGLCNNVVYDLQVDDSNNIWIGTSKGLSKFNGKEFQNFFTSDGLPDEWIWNIYIDENNTVWLGTKKGICSYSNNQFQQYTNQPNLSNQPVFAIKKTHDGNFLLGTGNGLLNFDGENFTLINRDKLLNNNKIYSVYEHKNNDVWLGTEKGLFLLKDNKVTQIIIPGLPSHKTVWAIHQNDEGNLLIGTDEGIRLYDFNNFHKYTSSSSGTSNYKIWTIFKDHESNTWFGGREGLYFQSNDVFKRYNDKNFTVNAWAIFENENKDIWIASELYGILEFKNGGFKKINTSDAFKSNSIICFYKDSKNNYWIGNDSGIAKFDGKNFTNFTKKMNLKPGPVMAITEDKFRNCLWLATYFQGVYCYDGEKTIHFDESSGITNNMVYDVFIDAEGRLWAGSDHGISRFKDGKFIVPEELQWLNKYAIMKILQDENKNLWFGTFELGLIKYDYHEKDPAKQFDTVNVNYGLNDNAIMSMSFDKNGDIWIGTNLGINKFDINEYYKTGNKNVIAYSKGDGFPGVETMQGGVLSDSEGNMWFGTTEGLIKFNPDEIKINKIPPYINITKIESYNNNFERETTYSNILHEIYYTDFRNLPYENNNLTIHFTGICFANAQKVNYKYRLNGGEWSPATKISTVSFSNMNSGDYTFEVIASNNNNIWNTVPAKINFRVTAPFYNRWWFYITTASLIVFFAYLLIKLRFDQVERKNKELRERIKERLKYEEKLKKSEQELIRAKEKAEKSDRLKSEFLAQMSHEIRTPVNSILSFTTLLRNELEDAVNEDLKDSFTIIESGGRRLIRTIDSILNMSQLQVGNFETRKENIDLKIIIETLYDEFKNSALQKKLDFRINKEGDSFKETRDEYTVTQLIANLIDNSLKYTPKGFVHINIFRNSKNNIVVEVKDSGIGISKEFQEFLFTAFTQEETGYTRKFEGSGLGLALVKKYAELNDIDITVDSEKGNGTTFSIEFLPN